MNIWRIFRLPGSRTFWHIDSGPGTKAVNVTGYISSVPTKSVDRPCGNYHPRAWIEVIDADFHIVNGIAKFDYAVLETENEPDSKPMEKTEEEG